MRSTKIILTGTVIALAFAGCSRSSAKSSSGTNPGTTVASSPATVAEFCDKVQGEAAAFDITGITTKSPSELKATYENLAPRLDALAEQAPAAIRDDFEMFIPLEKKLDGVLADAGYDPKQLSLSALPELTSPSTIAALQRIRTFFRDQCHFVDNRK